MEGREKWKKVSKNVVVKSRMTRFIESNLTQFYPVDKVVKFARSRFIIISSDFDQYDLGIVVPLRVFYALIFKAAIALTAIRYFISGMSNKKWVTVLMSDSNYLLGNKAVISSLISIAATIVLSVQCTLHLQELQHRCHLLTFLNDYKYKRVMPLSPRNSRKLAIRANLMTKYVADQAFWPLIIFTATLLVGSTVYAYFLPDSGFSLISIIVWSLILVLFLINLYGLVIELDFSN